MRTLRSRPLSLRVRLTAFVAAAIIVSAAFAFGVVYITTGVELRGQVDRDLIGDVTQFAEALRPAVSASPSAADGIVTRYVHAQPYSDTSTLLFVLIGGEPPISSYPAAFRSPGGSLIRLARSVEIGRRGPRDRLTTEHMPGVGTVRVVSRLVTIARRSAVVGVAEPLTFIDRAQDVIERAFVLAAALSLLLAGLVASLAGARVTAPLRRMAAVAARVDAGDRDSRMEPSAAYGGEVEVLAEAFNRMLDRLADAFSSQQGFLADASHELRTPLTVIRGQLEVLAASDDPPPEEVRRVERVVQHEVTRMARLVDDLMLLTAAEQDGFLKLEEVRLPEFVSELWDGLSLTADRHFEVGPIPDGTLIADPDRLAQALRNLGRNAIDHTDPQTGLVRLEAAAVAGGLLRFSVIDDGPGIPPRSASACSNGCTGPTRRALASPAAPGSASRSCARSQPPTTARRAPGQAPAASAPSLT